MSVEDYVCGFPSYSPAKRLVEIIIVNSAAGKISHVPLIIISGFIGLVYKLYPWTFSLKKKKREKPLLFPIHSLQAEFQAYITRKRRNPILKQTRSVLGRCLRFLYLLNAFLEGLREGRVWSAPLRIWRLSTGAELVSVQVPVENHHALRGLGVIHCWGDAHSEAMGLALGLDGVGGHCRDGDGDRGVGGRRVSSLVDAQLVAVGKDDVERHVLQHLHPVLASRDEGLLRHVWYVSLRREKRVFKLRAETIPGTILTFRMALGCWVLGNNNTLGRNQMNRQWHDNSSQEKGKSPLQLQVKALSKTSFGMLRTQSFPLLLLLLLLSRFSHVRLCATP